MEFGASDVFNVEKDELGRWPYTRYRVDETLDDELIADRARQLIYQSIAREDLVAFLGSGVPMAYGRTSWSEWLTQQFTAIHELKDAVHNCMDASIEYISKQLETGPNDSTVVVNYLITKLDEVRFQHDAVKRLSHTFSAMRPAETTGSDGADNFASNQAQIVFEIAERLQNLLLESISLFINPHAKELNERDKNAGFNTRAKHSRPPSKVFDDDWVREIEKRRVTNTALSKAYTNYCEHLEKLHGLQKQRRTHFTVAEFAKVLLVDETSHAEKLVMDGVRGLGRAGGKVADALSTYVASEGRENLGRQIDGIRDDPSRYWSLSFFRTETLAELADHLCPKDGSQADPTTKIIRLIKKQLQLNETPERGVIREIRRDVVSPTHRFVLPLLLQFVENPRALSKELNFLDAIRKSSKGIDAAITALKLNEQPLIKPVTKDTFLGRASIMDPTLDPLDKLVIGMGVRRFLTLNYDFEIERYFEDRGYAKFEEDPDEPIPTDDIIGQLKRRPNRVDGFGGVLRDETFRRERANELVNFAVEASSADASVFHLHGRATKRAPIVVTERDYMNLYLQDDKNRESVDESIRLAFAANTMLFAGLGMREEDLLRPLRQFMSDKDRDRAGTAVVLKPGFATREKRRQEAGLLYLRYGVHTIHFGDAWLTVSEVQEDKKVKTYVVQVPWGHLANKLLNALSDKVDEAKDTNASSCIDAASLREKLGTQRVRIGNEAKPVYVFDLLFSSIAKLRAEKELSNHLSALGRLELIATLTGDTPQIPAFCTERPDDGSMMAHQDRSQTYLGFEIEMLRLLVLLCCEPLKDGTTRKRQLLARETAIQGVKNSLSTGLLTLTLEYLRIEKDAWAADWQRSPPERLPRFHELTKEWPNLRTTIKKSEVCLPKVYIRHELKNTITPLPDPAKKRIFSLKDTGKVKTNIRAYDQFVNAIKTRCEVDRREHGSGRRMYLVCAYRGMGKGSFMSAMMTDKGLASYIIAHKSSSGSKPRYISALFVNLSFSSEIASVFDMMLYAIGEATARLICENRLPKKRGKVTEQDQTDAFDTLWSTVTDLPRIGRMKRIIREYDAAASKHKATPRLLIVINAVDLLHFSRGLIKNREIEEILAFLTGPATEESLFDLLMISGEFKVSEMLTGKRVPMLGHSSVEADDEGPTELAHSAKHLNFVPIIADDILLPGIHNVRQRMNKSQLEFRGWPLFANESGTGARPVRVRQIYDQSAPFDEPSWFREPVPFTSDKICYVHFTRPVRPETLLIDNFRSLAYVLFVGASHRSFSNNETTQPQREVCETWLKESTSDRAEFPIKSAANGHRHPRISDKYRATAWKTVEDEKCGRTAWRKKRKSRDKAVDNWIAQFVQEVRQTDENWLKPEVEDEPQGSREKATFYLQRRYDLSREDINGKDALLGRAARQWRELRVVLRDSRFCLTILLAAAERLVLQKRSLREGFVAAEAFITRTIDKVKLASGDKREQTVISEVLDSYEAYHVVGRPSDDNNLHMLLLRHLAVIAAPVSADVLVQTPEIRTYFEGIYTGNERPREVRLIEALTELADRGLVFELAEHPRIDPAERRAKDILRTAGITEEEKERRRKYLFGKNEPPHNMEQRRYALHRAMQRHIIKKMGSGPRDTMEINQFAPSIYASMPSDLPRLNRESYDFLNQLVDHFTEYPDHSNAEPGPQNWHQRARSVTTRVQALRAALSIIRSTFSIAVVSRFEDYADDKTKETALTSRGYFATYRVQVRWIIRKAYELLIDIEKKNDAYLSNRPDFPHINALYIDEIVWLYNECGLVDFVRGNLNDANAMLVQASTINRRVEGEVVGGPQYNRITLNLALVALERGRIDRANDMLKAICASEQQNGRKPGRIWHIATGYIGLVHHLLGEREAAAAKYQQSIQVLRNYQDSRACAVFLRHAGDLERAIGNYKQAGEMLDEAMAFAQAGGHQDLERRCALSSLRLQREQQIANGERPDMRHIIDELEAIAEYARRMEMPSLACDVMIVHASILIDDRESSQSGRLIARAMTLAKRNGMTLRLTTALVRYAHVLALRGLKPQSNRLLFYALDMAKRSRNQLEINAIDHVFKVLRTL